MKALAAALLAAATFTSMTTQAATRIDTEGFSLEFGQFHDQWMSMNLLSDEDGIVRIGFENIIVGATVTRGSDQFDRDASFIGSIAEGYRVTSMTLRGTYVGTVELTSQNGWQNWPGEISVAPGDASTLTSMSMWVQHGDTDTEVRGGRVFNLNGSHAFGTQYSDTVENTFGLFITSYASLRAQAEEVWLYHPDGGWGYNFGTALASIRADDVVLTLHVSAVPEPATYGMLIGGLGILGYVARRRKGAAVN
ncbi:PEP-CTERM sorting domain-containing protein [Pseudoduganella plicata]|uniref:Ice-binding protein C-terminal domain-containing protein n=1 Tax=Pseudoduganella plicata TaxID=321984 RepID=A0AA87YEX4_9BURK|nr:PEP-CTERM sorting domain-containing protein [Pseudoduganella plicata]GGY97310.1 hypothetical protein GCM10007388_33740 [Pseudoduganella plicata]